MPITAASVYRDTLDDVVGIIHIKDLFAHLPANHPSIDQLLRPALFISPAIRLLDLCMKCGYVGGI